MKALPSLSLAVVSLALASAPGAQNIQLEAFGTLTNNALSSGPLAGLPTGQPVHLTMELITPGFDLTPGQYTNYAIDTPTFALTTGGVSVGIAPGTVVGIQNDHPVADGVHLFETAMDQPGYFFAFELFDGTGGILWGSTDVTTLAGDYPAPLFQSYAFYINGGAFDVAFEKLTIHAPPSPAAVVPYGCGVNPAGSLTATGVPALGTTLDVHLHNPLGTQASGSLAALTGNLIADAAFPCGTVLPGFGMAGGGAPGELLVGLGGPAVSVGAWTGSPVSYSIPIANDSGLIGTSVFVQGVILDFTPGAGAPIGLTEALELQVGV